MVSRCRRFCRFPFIFFMLPLGVVLRWSFSFGASWLDSLGEDRAEVPGGEPEYLFRLWVYDVYDFSVETSYVLEMASELEALGHRVLVESAVVVKGAVRGVRVNPHLKQVLESEPGAAESAIKAFGGSQTMVIWCFSSLWTPFFLQLPVVQPAVYVVWYFYEPLPCKVPSSISYRRSWSDAMAKADRVIFLRSEDQKKWSQYLSSSILTFFETWSVYVFFLLEVFLGKIFRPFLSKN